MAWTFLHISDNQPGSPRSFRFNPRYMENWQTAYRQLQRIDADLLLVGGDLTRDGYIHDFELARAKEEFDALPYPYYAIPGNMDTGNKPTAIPGATGSMSPPRPWTTSRAFSVPARGPSSTKRFASPVSMRRLPARACHTSKECGIS